MKYLPSFDISPIAPAVLARYVQPGQHVYATDRSCRGVYLGVRSSGTVVVAWNRNALGRRRDYISTLRTYAKSDSYNQISF